MKNSFFKHVLVQNFLALSTLQIINMVLPFVTLPYLARVLGVSNYGVVMMVYSVMQLLFVFNDYGFNLSATREISKYRKDKKRVNTIFSSIMVVKCLFIILSLVLLAVLLNTVTVMKAHKLAYLLGFGMVLGQSFTPLWLFQGMERMKYVTLVNLISKGVFTVLIFVFITRAEHYVYVPLLYSTGFVIAGVASLFLVFKEFGIEFIRPRLKEVVAQIRNSAQYFFSRVSISAYTTGNNFIVGIVLGEYAAGIFGVAEKLYQAMVVVYSPLSDAIYPHMVIKRDLSLFKKVFIGVLAVNLIVAGFTFVFSNGIVDFIFGEGYDTSGSLLKYFCFLAVVIVPTIFMGYPLLGAFGFEKHANYSIVAGSIIHFLIIIFFYPYLSLTRMVLLLIFTQCIVFSVRLQGVITFIRQASGTQEMKE